MALTLALLQPRTSCVAYDYHNAATPDYTNTMWVMDGLVSFMGRDTRTDYHGSFTHLDHASIQIRFDHLGRLDKMKNVVLFKTGVSKWEGYDYAGRHITLTQKQTLVWRPDENFWAVVTPLSG